MDTSSIKINAGVISVTDFGAIGDGQTDDWQALINCCNYAMANPKLVRRVRFPAGYIYRITKPLLLQNNGSYFTIVIGGDFSAKSSPDQYLSTILCDYKASFGIGIQYGRAIVIENLSIIGRYSIPSNYSTKTLGTLKFSDWADPTVTDSRYAPYAGLSVDPNQNASGTRGGTSDMTIRGCKFLNWSAGLSISPNGVTQNAEMINIENCCFGISRIAIAICQDQAKTIKISGLKCWGGVHTIIDGLSYGAGTGGGSIFCENWNIAGGVNQLFNVHTDRFPLSCKDIYAESLFRIGTIKGLAGANFINSSFDFLTGPGMPAADYILYGCANFYGGCIRYYDNSQTHRLNFTGFTGKFRDLVLNNAPITIGLYGVPPNCWPEPSFDNVNLYYSGKALQCPSDGLIDIRVTTLTIDRTAWIATITGKGVDKTANVGDYILGVPTSTTRLFWDLGLNPESCNTIQVGRVIGNAADTLYLDDVGVNAFGGLNYYDAFHISRTN